jgi:predicted nucleotidyltransferase
VTPVCLDKIFLFGSEATGSSGPNSDIDLLVILDQDTVVVLFVSPQINHIKTRQVFDFYLIDSPGPANQDKV